MPLRVGVRYIVVMSEAQKGRMRSIAEEIGKRRPFDLLEEEVYLNLARTYEHLVSPFGELFKDHGLSVSQYNALRIVVGAGRPGLPVGEIARRMIFREPDVTRLVRRLETAGWVVRERSERDRRVVLVEATGSGKGKIKALHTPVRRLLRDLLGHMGEKRLGSLNDLLVDARSGDGEL